MSTDDHKPIPLTEWIVGTLALYFPGATVKRRMTLRDAQDIQAILDDRRAADRLAWHHLAWTAFDETKVLASEFDAAEDLGWALTPEDRATLTKHGHPHGILRTLRDHWQDKGREPAYSVLALGQLHRAAVDGMPQEKFAQFAENLEGEAGARVLREALDHVARESTQRARRETPNAASVPVDDSAEPETATDEPEPPSTETGGDEHEENLPE